MKACFVDTSGWMMLSAADEVGHEPAVRFRDSWLEKGGLLVSTDYVLDETLTLLRVRLDIDAAHEFWERAGSSPRIRWEAVGGERAARARDWFFRWRDQDFSITDCTSFVVMRELGLRTVLTGDRHFRVAGFDVVPGQSPARRR